MLGAAKYSVNDWPKVSDQSCNRVEMLPWTDVGTPIGDSPDLRVFEMG